MVFGDHISKSLTHMGSTGAFLTVTSPKGTNTMTIAWGFVGVIWSKPYFITLVRPTRYTKEFLDGANSFTISFPWENLKKELGIVGSRSGRDIDKSKVVEFAPAQVVESQIVKGCKAYLECKIKYVDQLDQAKLPPEINSFYNNDLHYMYFGEIVADYEARG
ncbi:MAG: flavin reductase family protein [Clostridiales bacterium]|jgi:flavin reductase (DIM6/NTAB) family NADH-FMN oxidoreductase RutF|nr:flavin reductase family protein [Clostridiales bacterium]